MGRLLSTALLVGFLALVGNGSAVAITITPTVDGTVRDGLTSPKDGIPDAAIESSVVQALDVSRPTSPFEDRGIIEFDVSGVANQPVNLILPVFGSMGPFPFTVDVFSYTGDGLLTLSDFNQGTLFTSFSFSGESNVVVDVTSAIADVLLAGGTFAGFNLQFAVPTNIELNGPFVAFNSLEIGDRPAQLDVVPLPAAIWLFLTALSGMGFLGWHRKRIAEATT